MDNPFLKRGSYGGGCQDSSCMCRFENSQEWCDHRNSTMERPDLKWVLGPSGELLLVDREEWSDAHAKAEDDHKESERRKFNWRQDHPIRSE